MTWHQKPPLGTPLDWKNSINKGTVLHLAMNEGHGDKIQDLSMYGNHGTLKNFAFPPTVNSGWNPGQTGVGLNFDDTDDYISIDHNTSQDITNQITLSYWVWRDADTWQNILTSSNDGVTGYVLSCVTLNRIDFFLKSGSGGTDGEIKSNALGGVPINGWYNVVGTYDGALMKTYINGKLQASLGWTDTISITGLGIFIGAAGDPRNFFSGKLNEPRIMNRAWTPEEVKSYYINPWQVYLDD